MKAIAVLVALYSLSCLTNILAYPLLSMPQFPVPLYEGKVKRNEDNLGFPLTDDDVLQLEHLKRDEGHVHTEKPTVHATELLAPASNGELIPEVDHQLEVAKTNAETVEIKTDQEPHTIPAKAEQPPNIGTNTATITTTTVPSMAKQYHGAARLAFGQHPEVLPTSSIISTTNSSPTRKTPITPIVTSTISPIQSKTNLNEPTNLEIMPTTDNHQDDIAPLHSDTLENANSKLEQEIVPIEEEAKPTESEISPNVTPINVGELTEDELLESAKIAARRSLPSMSFKAAERLLQHGDGQYSAFDMAQYVFWTGDETGVARAVEELIERGLMSRENALKFLREIRLGIEYLERSYASRVMPVDLRPNHIKKSYTIQPRLVVPPTTTTMRPIIPLWRSSKQLDSAATWSKLQELNTNQENADYDEASGRAKIAQFLYTEYTLEEILYKLAKVMFTQSLAHGSDEAQKELQKLTDFLEREGNLGVIPVDLQKKVLNTLLTALSDTLSEHPELLPAARSNLAFQINKLDNE